MIETYEGGARVIVGAIKRFMSSPAGVFIYSSATGVIGILILLMFLAMVLSPTALPPVLPMLVAFNGAASGYALIDKIDTFPHHHIALAFLALILTAAGCTIIAIYCPWEPLLDTTRYLITGFSALAFTYFGAWIAGKSKLLKNDKGSSTSNKEV